jgi:hypothetical protein
MRITIAIGILGILATQAQADQQFSNGPARAALIELFTSEGCSTCPPADKWLRTLRSKPGLWKEFVPVEFHVNFWDTRGWKDRFSTPATTQREYDYANLWGCTPYTPCFARNGVRWKPSWGVAAGPGAPMGILSVSVDDNGICKVDFLPGAAARGHDDDSFEVYIALLGDGLLSKITDGENGGQLLEHDFVVLGLASQILTPAAGSSPLALSAKMALPRPVVAEGIHHALAAWVTVHGDMEPIQATGGWLF